MSVPDSEPSRDGGSAESETVPCAFVSYSWTSPEHKERVKEWADRLLSDGVEVKLDIYDLKEGDDKYAYMETMATDPSVSHVLVFSDREYARKADARRAGVGVESQIISKEVYEQVAQSKFIPIVCELDASGKPTLPEFMKSRIWLDFSTNEKVNESWERLIRLLHGRPEHVKPQRGQRPSYLDEAPDQNLGVIHARFRSLESAVLGDARGVDLRRSDFLDACMKHADELRIREHPGGEALGTRIVRDCRKLMVVRDALVDWVALEMGGGSQRELAAMLTGVLEKLLELKARPEEVTQWNNEWFGAHSVFVYETFLYVVAALVRAQGFDVLRTVFKTHYLLPETDRYGEESFCGFDKFYGYSRALSETLQTPNGQRYLSPAAELLKRQATRTDIVFKEIIQAELLTFMVTLVSEGSFWYPGTLNYAGYGWVAPLFLRATRHADFLKLGCAVGFDDADSLRQAVKKGSDAKLSQYRISSEFGSNPLRMMNIDRLDTLH